MKKIILFSLVVLVTVVAYFTYQMFYPQPIATNPTPSASDKPITYTLAQVAEHADKESCWIVLDDKVYDVTPFVQSGFHPGKDAILQGCGKDATILFNTRPMGTGTSHSERARSMLPKYFIGDLAK